MKPLSGNFLRDHKAGVEDVGQFPEPKVKNCESLSVYTPSCASVFLTVRHRLYLSNSLVVFVSVVKFSLVV
jgi:hypothetical protein